MVKTSKKFILCCILLMLLTVFFSNISNAATQYGDLNDKWFFIKNAYTGHYLDVYYGIAQGGTNVQQHEYNGAEAQR